MCFTGMGGGRGEGNQEWGSASIVWSYPVALKKYRTRKQIKRDATTLSKQNKLQNEETNGRRRDMYTEHIQRRGRLKMELDLQSLFGLYVYSCTHWLRHSRSPIPPEFGLIYEGAIGQPRQTHLFVTPWTKGSQDAAWMEQNTQRVWMEETKRTGFLMPQINLGGCRFSYKKSCTMVY